MIRIERRAIAVAIWEIPEKHDEENRNGFDGSGLGLHCMPRRAARNG